jgi:hypothetical protein
MDARIVRVRPVQHRIGLTDQIPNGRLSIIANYGRLSLDSGAKGQEARIFSGCQNFPTISSKTAGCLSFNLNYNVISGTTNGARYCRVNIAFASGSFLQLSVWESK